MKKILFIIIVTLLLTAVVILVFKIQPVMSEPRTWTVDDDGPADFHTIQDAIDAASPGDTILIASGLYHTAEDGTWVPIIIDKTLRLFGEDPYSTIVEGTISGMANEIWISRLTVGVSPFGGWPLGPIWIVGDNGILTNDILIGSGHYNLDHDDASVIIQGSGWFISNNLLVDPYTPFPGPTSFRSSGGGLAGILLDGSNNIVTYNQIGDETAISGCSIRGCRNNNAIHHNNFYSIRSWFGVGTGNIWDDGYPSGGNYWHSYSDVDFCRGPHQNETGSDGIWDHPYIIDMNNQDNYPLVNPWALNATVDITPNTLNLHSKAKHVSTFIELPEGYNVSDISVSSILLNNTIPVDLSAPTAIGDYDSDGIPDLMVKFDRAEVISYILANINITKLIEERFMTITLTVTGKLNDGTLFQGSDTIRIIMPKPRGRLRLTPT